MVFKGIILPLPDGEIVHSKTKGQPLDEKTLNPIMGYQAAHKVTGTLYPMCQPFEIYGRHALTDKRNVIAEALAGTDFCPNEYDNVPIYLIELDDDQICFVCIMNELDNRENDIFN